jgi:hypothetical protein
MISGVLLVVAHLFCFVSFVLECKGGGARG